MKKILIVGVILLGVLITCAVVLMRNLNNVSNANYIEFTATIARTPSKTAQTEDYYVYFNNVKTTEEDEQELEIFNNGGVLITQLPEGKEIKPGDKIAVTLHREFAATHSLPPQIIGNSVISVSFKG